jgi:hypothetical protein
VETSLEVGDGLVSRSRAGLRCALFDISIYEELNFSARAPSAELGLLSFDEGSLSPFLVGLRRRDLLELKTKLGAVFYG